MAKKKSISGTYSYKIRDRMTGLFRVGGADKGSWSWSKTGKTWTTWAAFKSHLSQYAPNPMPAWWEIIVVAPIPGTNINAEVARNMTEIEVVELAFEHYLASKASSDESSS